MSLVQNLQRQYDWQEGEENFSFELRIPRWEISDSGITVLWGPSGSGKSTVFRALIGLERIEEMTWEFKGQDLNRLPIKERNLGVVFQDLQLFPHMSGRENIRFAMRARGVDLTKESEFFARWNSALGLSRFMERPVSVLSGGEKQRIAIARSIVGSPRILMLDEPFSALDEHLRGESRHLVQTVIQELNIPALVITHDQHDLENFADHVVKIEAGHIAPKR